MVLEMLVYLKPDIVLSVTIFVNFKMIWFCKFQKNTQVYTGPREGYRDEIRPGLGAAQVQLGATSLRIFWSTRDRYILRSDAYHWISEFTIEYTCNALLVWYYVFLFVSSCFHNASSDALSDRTLPWARGGTIWNHLSYARPVSRPRLCSQLPPQGWSIDARRPEHD